MGTRTGSNGRDQAEGVFEPVMFRPSSIPSLSSRSGGSGRRDSRFSLSETTLVDCWWLKFDVGQVKCVVRERATCVCTYRVNVDCVYLGTSQHGVKRMSSDPNDRVRRKPLQTILCYSKAQLVYVSRT